MKEKLLAFLRLMEQLVPCPGQHHAITFCQFGSDVVGWEENLGLHMRLPGNKTMTLFMDDGDLELPAHVLAGKCLMAMKAEGAFQETSNLLR